ncbi:Gp138 family membrane-puncturing spike protein [Pseudomonas sichuanensis]|uniref:Gp138 family membrane-puncturing spike protein n=1 Tax=Pseudomonas sichuanensis TaxID=2213015 RepID=UPI001300908C|nr:Gp138 family membrane-puncturing spike protein [Pseudomonas sichuanensis]
MNVNERLDDPLTPVLVAQRSAQSKLWTSLPGIIQSFDPVAMTCVVQPAIQAFVTTDDGAMVLTSLPLLLDCPVQFPAGGGCTLTFPVKPNDECLVVFASRCIDSWWQSGGVQAQAELRMHDLSDGFALLGFRSQPRVIGGVSQQAVQLRSDDGQAFIEVNPTSHAINATTIGAMTASAEGGMTLTAPLVTINGNVQVNGRVDTTEDVKAGDISLQAHRTSGVIPGPGTSGVPVV